MNPKIDRSAFPLEQAQSVAEELKAGLAPVCERIEIAGSIRRRKPIVGDIELLFIPKLEERPMDLFSKMIVDRADEQLERWLREYKIVQRLSIVGSPAWGKVNKLAIHTASGIPVDFFSTTEANWWNSLVMRTGSRESNLRLTQRAHERGWTFEAYGAGYRARHGREDFHQTTSERDVFEFIGLPYRPPEER